MFQNKIRKEFRLARRENQEFCVFSTEFEDPSQVTDWVAVNRAPFVLLDPTTYEKIKNNKLKWIFDDENHITACSISEPEQKS